MTDDAAATAHEPVNEYEREPVPERAWLGLRSFVGQYAGEHTAGTELMIGPLFVASGVSAANVVGGLLIGNLLAVLSWLLLIAPIAVRARLTSTSSWSGSAGATWSRSTTSHRAAVALLRRLDRSRRHEGVDAGGHRRLVRRDAALDGPA